MHQLITHLAALPALVGVHSSILDPSTFLAGAGPWFLVIIAVMVFIETGLLFPFLPGDTLVFTAALLAPSLHLSPALVIGVAAAAAVAGDQVGFLIGRRFGRRLFRPDARILKTKYLDQTDEFFTRYGPFSLVLARFVPVVRTYVPPVAGASHMPYRRFVTWNVIGGIGWAVIVGVAGLLLGRVPFVAHNLDLIAVLVAVISLLPVAITLIRERQRSRAAAAATGEERRDQDPVRR